MLTYDEAKLLVFKLFDDALPRTGQRYRWVGSRRTWPAHFFYSKMFGVSVHVGEPCPMPVSIWEFLDRLNEGSIELV